MKKQKGKSYEGFESLNISIRQHLKMLCYTGLFCFAIALCATVVASYLWYDELWKAIMLKFQETHKIPKLQFAWDAAEFMAKKSMWIFILNLLWVYGLFICLIVWFKGRAKKQSADIHMAGAKLITPQELNDAIRKDKKQTYTQLGSVKIPVDAESKHTLFVGRPGTGKTMAMSQIIAQLRARGDAGIVYDFKGDYFAKFYNSSKDIFFNVLDERGVNWQFFSEVKTKMDVEAMAASLIPEAEGDAQFWNQGARAVFIGLLHFLVRNKRCTNKDIWDVLTARSADIARWLSEAGEEGRSGYTYVQDPSSKQAIGVLSTLAQYTRAFQYLTSNKGQNFCITDWVKNRNGWIFVSNHAELRDSLKPIISLFIDTIARKILSLPDDRSRRIPIFIDEFGTLQKLTSLQNLLLLGRSKGACVSLGCQDIGQIDNIYTQSLRQSIVNACGTSLVLGVSDPDTAKFLSDKIGDVTFSRLDRTKSYGLENAKNGFSLSHKAKTEKLILASDIMNLRELDMYMKLPDYFLTKTCIEKVYYAEKHPYFLMREDLRIKEASQLEEEDPLDRLFSSGSHGL